LDTFVKFQFLFKFKPPASRAYAPEGKTKILTTPVRSAGPTGQAVILVVFRGLKFESDPRQKAPKDGQLLFLSPFDANKQRISTKTSHYRNLFVAALSTVIFVAHASPASKTEVFCKEILSWQKPIYTFESDYNKNLIKMGVRPIRPEKLGLKCKGKKLL
jgi:hypothetical protein